MLCVDEKSPKDTVLRDLSQTLCKLEFVWEFGISTGALYSKLVIVIIGGTGKARNLADTTNHCQR